MREKLIVSLLIYKIILKLTLKNKIYNKKFILYIYIKERNI